MLYFYFIIFTHQIYDTTMPTRQKTFKFSGKKVNIYFSPLPVFSYKLLIVTVLRNLYRFIVQF